MVAAADEILLAEARRALDEQRATLTDTRNRAGLAFTVAGVTSSLLAGPALDGHKEMPGLGWLALGLLLLCMGLAVAVWWPRGFQGVKPTVLSDPKWGTRTPEDAARYLVGYAADAWDDNENGLLKRLWWGVRAAMILALASIGAWVLLLAKGP